MPNYAIQNIVGDSTSGVTLGEARNSNIPAGAVISPKSYDNIKDTFLLLTVIDAGDIRVMTAAEKLAVPQSTIDAYRDYLKEAVDNKTDLLRSAGFEYPAASGKMFEILDPVAKANWIGIMQAADKGVLTTQEIYDKNRIPYTLTDVTDINNFWGTALTFETTVSADGGAILDQLNLANTIADLEAIVDNR